MTDVERSWKVGELARATGLTIRALHHYDEIGLLVPARTESGHRVYGPADVERLYRVLALRGVGMGLDDIAAALDDDGVSLIETVRRHVAVVEREIDQRQRLLDRLRDMLDAMERSPAPPVDELIGAVEAMTVVEATIENIVTRDRWDAAWELQEPYVILLRESEGERLLPIWIGQPEAAALVMARRNVTTPRPMGHDLMVALLSAVDARVERVVIECLRDNTFLATVSVLSGGEQHEVDARPSDALNIALRAGAPIQIASNLIETAGRTDWPGACEAPVEGSAPPPWMPVDERAKHAREQTYRIDESSPPLLRLAADQARDLGHDFVAPGHLMLGILADDGPAARLLERHGITLKTTQAAVAAKLADHDWPSPRDTTKLTPGAMFAMHRASVEARRRGTVNIAPMQVLLALLDSPDASERLGLSNVDITAIRDDVRSQLQG
jgi:bifunctional DNase/RNase/DNA-binding transcriptional MerR regulator